MHVYCVLTYLFLMIETNVWYSFSFATYHQFVYALKKDEEKAFHNKITTNSHDIVYQ